MFVSKLHRFIKTCMNQILTRYISSKLSNEGGPSLLMSSKNLSTSCTFSCLLAAQFRASVITRCPIDVAGRVCNIGNFDVLGEEGKTVS